MLEYYVDFQCLGVSWVVYLYWFVLLVDFVGIGMGYVVDDFYQCVFVGVVFIEQGVDFVGVDVQVDVVVGQVIWIMFVDFVQFEVWWCEGGRCGYGGFDWLFDDVVVGVNIWLGGQESFGMWFVLGVMDQVFVLSGIKLGYVWDVVVYLWVILWCICVSICCKIVIIILFIELFIVCWEFIWDFGKFFVLIVLVIFVILVVDRKQLIWQVMGVIW